MADQRHLPLDYFLRHLDLSFEQLPQRVLGFAQFLQQSILGQIRTEHFEPSNFQYPKS